MKTHKLHTICTKETSNSIVVYEDLFATNVEFCNMVLAEYNECEYCEVSHQIRGVQAKVRAEKKDYPYVGVWGLLYDDTPIEVSETDIAIEDDMILLDGKCFVGLVLKGTFYHKEIDGSNESVRQYERYVFVPFNSDKYIQYHLEHAFSYDPPTDIEKRNHVKYILEKR